MRIAVVPAYKPDERMLQVLKEAHEAGFRIVVVDDGSGTEFSEAFAQARKYGHVISYPVNKGKGHALKTAFVHIINEFGDKGFTVVTLDSDGQHKIRDAIRVCETAEKHPRALVLGSRKQSKASPWKSRFGNGVTRVVFRWLTGVGIRDTQTGLRAFNASFLRRLLLVPGARYEYEMNVLLYLAKTSCKMIEVPIETVYIRNNAGSHFRAVRDSISIYKEILKFSVSSLAGFLTDYLLYSLIVLLAGPRGILLANVAARLVSASVNFAFNYRYVFHSRETLANSALKYFTLACAILICNSALLYLFSAVGGWNPFLAKIVVELLLFVGSWLVQRAFVFAVR